MRIALIRFLLSLALLAALVFVWPFNPALALLGILFIPATFLAWVDLGRAVRKAPASSFLQRVLGILVSLPQALFGLVSLLAGVTMIVSFFYWPARNGGTNWVILVIGPLLALFGIKWLRDAFKTKRADTQA